MKESLEKDNNEFPLICSICHKQKLDIKKNSLKFKKQLNNAFKDIELSELIIKCNCNYNNIQKNKNSELYSHKFCILIKVLLNFEIKCEKCNTIYNLKIDKEIDINKKIILFSTFLIIYIIHLFIYLFCMFLLFINLILKEYKLIKYKHLSYFFAIILLIINSIFLYFSINKNIDKRKGIYKYSINIFDIININTFNKEICSINNEDQFFHLLFEFYQWFYKQPIKNLLNLINKKYLINKINLYYNNSIKNYVQKNNQDIIIINKKEDINNDVSILKNKGDTKNNNSNELILNNNKIDKNKNISFNQNSKKITQENTINTNKISKIEEINRIENNNNNNNPINYNRKPSKNNLSLNSQEDKYKLNRNDYINININPKASNNININIHFNNDKSALLDFSSNKEVMVHSNKKVNKYGRFGRTAFIPKKLSMTNLISEANSFKRKRRIVKSIKMRQNNSYLKNRGISGNIAEDEEVDLSEFDGTKISKFKNTLLNKNELDLKNSNFRSKRSYKDADMDLSNSDLGPIQEINSNQNLNNSLKNRYSNKHVHFADP